MAKRLFDSFSYEFAHEVTNLVNSARYFTMLFNELKPVAAHHVMTKKYAASCTFNIIYTIRPHKPLSNLP
jgi:hypothetical protein